MATRNRRRRDRVGARLRAVAVGATCATAFAQQPILVPSEELVPIGARVVAASDVDADGDLDLLCADGSSAPPTVLLNDGGGRFAPTSPPTTTVVGGVAFPGRTLAAEDFNGDGLLDVAYAAQSAVVLRFGVAPGVFGSVATLPPPMGGVFASYSVSAGDVDADGDADLLIGQALGPPFHPTSSTARLWLNAGTGTFIDATATSGIVAANVVATLTDLDGDGLPDAVGQSTVDFPGSSGWFVAAQRNLGGGVFGPPLWIAGAASSFSGGPCVAPFAQGDFDGDGDADLLLPGPFAGQVQIVRGTGPFAFTTDPPTNVGPECVVALAAVDLDGDAADEAVFVFAQRTEVRRFQNGALGPPSATVVEGCDAASPLAARTVVADADGDGDRDLLLCGDRGPRRWLFNDGAGGFAAPYGRTPGGAYRLAGQNFERPTAARLDGDARPDLIVAGGGALGAVELRVAVNDGEGGFPAPSTIVLPGTAAAFDASAIAAFDADGDGDDDALFGVGSAGFSAAAPFLLLRNDGPAGFSASSLGAPPSAVARAGAAADFDGDGDVDLALGLAPVPPGATGEVRWFANDGAGAFAHVATSGALTGAPQRCAVADLDGDGDLDLALVPSAGPGATLLNAGGFAFVPGPTFPAASSSSLQAADLDGDADVDLLAGGAYHLYSAGAYGYGGFAPFGLTASPSTAVDVDADGLLDLHLHADGSLWKSFGGYFAPSFGFAPLPPDPSGSTVWADLDGDGDDDAVSAEFIVFENRSRGLAVRLHPRPNADAGFDLSGPPFGSWLLAASSGLALAATTPTPFGDLAVDPATALVVATGAFDATGRAAVLAFLPAAYAVPLVGSSFVFQAVAADLAGVSRLTGARTTRVLAY